MEVAPLPCWRQRNLWAGEFVRGDEQVEKRLELKKLPPKGSVMFTLRIPEVYNTELEKLVSETGISRNRIITLMVEFGLENYYC